MPKLARLPALVLALVITSGCSRPAGTLRPFPDGFAWGATTSAIEVEGHLEADGRGPSSLAGDPVSVAADHYDRYQEDIGLLAAIGVTHHRFSLSWPRILPDGTGTVNQAGLAHYAAVLDALEEAGITPMVTLFDGDLPTPLEAQGGWRNPESVAWFAAYAQVVLDAFGDRVGLWISVEEPYVNLMQLTGLVAEAPEPTVVDPDTPDISRAPPFVQARRAAARKNPLQVAGAHLADRAQEVHHQLLAHVAATDVHDAVQADRESQMGIVLRLTPVLPAAEGADTAVAIEDGIRNRWVLGALFSGAYPADILSLYDGFEPESTDLERIQTAGTDFVGVNYYAPTRVAPDSTSSRFGIRLIANPDFDSSYLGEAVADGLYQALTRVSADYGNPPVYVTGNGAGYGPLDERVEAGRIRDELRVRFLRRHIVKAQGAYADGVDLRGYFIRSALDGVDPHSGEQRRLGLIHVDYATQERRFKDSARYYRSVIAANAVSRMPF